MDNILIMMSEGRSPLLPQFSSYKILCKFKRLILNFQSKKIHIIKINLTPRQFEYANIDSVGLMVSLRKYIRILCIFNLQLEND